MCSQEETDEWADKVGTMQRLRRLFGRTHDIWTEQHLGVDHYCARGLKPGVRPWFAVRADVRKLARDLLDGDS